MTNKRKCLEKLFMTNPDDKEGLQPCEAMSYAICGFGQNLISQVVSAYLTYYLTDGLLVASSTVGYIMLGARIFDAFCDPIMGTIVDHTHSKWGKSRPYLLFASIPIAILTIICFLPYQKMGLPFGNQDKSYETIILVTLFYLLWSISYTIVDVPYWGLATSMTSNTHQRGTILTVARLFCTAGSGVVSIVVPQFANAWTSPFYDESGQLRPDVTREQVATVIEERYIWMVLAIVIIALPMFYLGFKTSKERFYDPSQNLTLKQNLNLLFKNKPLLLIVLSGVLGGGKILYLYSTMYVAQYCFASIGGTSWATLFTMATVPGGLIASILVPWATKKWGKRKTYIVSHIIGGGILIGSYFIAKIAKHGNIDNSIVLIIYTIALVVGGVPQGFANIITYAQIADCVEYMEWKSGERGEGICFAMQTFINKIGIALGAAFSCFGLALAGIKDASLWDQMTPEAQLHAQQFLIAITLIFPGGSMILSAIPYFFYKFNEKEQAQAVAEIAERKRFLTQAESMSALTENSTVKFYTNDENMLLLPPEHH